MKVKLCRLVKNRGISDQCGNVLFVCDIGLLLLLVE